MAKKEVVPKPDMSVKEKENDGGIGGGDSEEGESVMMNLFEDSD